MDDTLNRVGVVPVGFTVVRSQEGMAFNRGPPPHIARNQSSSGRTKGGEMDLAKEAQDPTFIRLGSTDRSRDIESHRPMKTMPPSWPPPLHL